ncbi:MAG TPA: DUF6776 family protein [Gammaproteobacteria bacterium]
MARLVIKSHRPLQFSLAVVLLSMLVAFVTWLGLDESHWSVIRDRLQSNRDQKLLWEVNQGLEEENAKLRERVSMLERTTSLDTQTATLLQEEIKNLQEETFRLKGELEFFQGIMEAVGEVKGLDVHGIHVRKLSAPGTYRLKLILTNVTDSDKDTEGTISVTIEGIQSGATRHVNLRELTLDESLDLTFKFRNFKRVESNFGLPPGFSAQRVFVELQPRDQKQSKIRKAFDWPATAG